MPRPTRNKVGEWWIVWALVVVAVVVALVKHP